jgi:branched-chain amino acid transport system ATP-binding protein
LVALAGKGMSEPLLDIRGLEVRYNKKAIAISGIELAVGEGEIVAVLGANGAGKTTLLRAISGFLPADNAAVTAGDIRFAGQRIAGRLPQWIARRGISLVAERDKVFATLSVEENLAAVPVASRAARREGLEFIHELFPILAERRRQAAGLLSGGERQMLAIAKSMLAQPRLLLCDELSMGISPVLSERLFDSLRRINAERGTSMLIVEQNAASALELAGRAYVLETGRLQHAGTSDELRGSEAVSHLYLGLGGEQAAARPAPQTDAREILRADDISLRFGGNRALDGVTISVREGSVFGLIGPNGAGKTSLLNCICGVYRPQAGRITFDGRQLSGLRPDQIIQLGIGRTFQHVHLLPDSSVLDNVLLGVRDDGRPGLLWSLLYRGPTAAREAADREWVYQLLETCGLLDVHNREVRSLSWGQQKRIEIARALAGRPRLLLLDEPTSGMNPEEKDEVAELILRVQTEQRLTQVVIEHNVRFIRQLSEHVTVLDFGRVIASGTPEDVLSDPVVVEAYIGRRAGLDKEAS